MNPKKLILATLASFVVMFALGGLFHMVIAKDFMLAHAGIAGDISRKEPLMIYIGLGVLVLAFMMSYMYPKGVEGENHLVQGFKFGMMIGIIWITPFSLILYGSVKMFSLTNVAAPALWHILEQGIGGMVIAMVYGKTQKAGA